MDGWLFHGYFTATDQFPGQMSWGVFIVEKSLEFSLYASTVLLLMHDA